MGRTRNSLASKATALHIYFAAGPSEIGHDLSVRQVYSYLVILDNTD